MNDPTVNALEVHHGHRTRDITIRCPHCEKLHTHGWPYGPGAPGHRVAHCWRVRDTVTGKWRQRTGWDDSRGYRIVIADTTRITGLVAA